MIYFLYCSNGEGLEGQRRLLLTAFVIVISKTKINQLRNQTGTATYCQK